MVEKKYLNKINLSTGNISENSTSTEKAKQIKAQAKSKNINELKEGWGDKPLHGKYLIGASDSNRISSLTNHWLASSDLKSETGFHHSSTIPEPTKRNFQANILENGADPKWRVCDKHSKTIDRPPCVWLSHTSTHRISKLA